MTFTNHTGQQKLVWDDGYSYIPNRWADPCGCHVIVLMTRIVGKHKPTKPRKKRGQRG